MDLSKRATRWIAAVAVGALALAGCGDDDSDASTDTTVAEATTTAAPSEELTELCAVAQEIYEADSFPTPEQIERYRAVAPDELQESIELAGAAIVDSGDDFVALFNALAKDDVEAATTELDAYEEANCAIPHSEDDSLPEGAVRDVEDDANQVAVTATDYAFEVDGEVTAGRTTFTVTNNGAEAHFLGIGKLKDGVTVDQALEAEDPATVLDGEWDTNLASAGGDEESVTFDVEPGEYALVCFIPDAEGTPHAFLGMVTPLTVAS
jgi:hypothetical protein